MLAHYGLAVTSEHGVAEMSNLQSLRRKLHGIAPLCHVLKEKGSRADY